MDSLFLYSMLPVEIAITLFAIVAGYLVISLPRTYKFRFVLIPLLVVGSFFTFQWFASTLGYPVSQLIHEPSMLMNYRVTTVKSEKKIEMWVLPLKDKSRSRLIVVPWSKEQEEKLNEAKKQRQQNGSLIILKKKEDKEGKRREGNLDEMPYFEIQVLQPKFFAPKDYEERQ